MNRIKNLYGVIDCDNIVRVSNRRQGEVFKGYFDEMPTEIGEYLVVVIRSAFDPDTNMTMIEIKATENH